MKGLTECWLCTTSGGIMPLDTTYDGEGSPSWADIRHAIGASLLEPREKYGNSGSLNAVVYCDEEGYFRKHNEINMIATNLLGGPIVGDVVIQCAPNTLFVEVI